MAPALHLKELLTYDRAAPMLFTGGEFLFWFSLVYLGFLALRERRGSRILYLTLASWFFYYKCSGAFLLALLFTSGADFLIAQCIHKTESERGRRLLLSLSILLSGGILVYFKYTNFFMGSIARMLTGRFDPLDIVLPAGISFYTFESVSYVVDVYRRRVAPTRHFFEYACYLAYFPHILAGPILRAGDLLE
ncbi:MAG TPA: MBOAT family protein, partial [Polyangiaceae bacterium]